MWNDANLGTRQGPVLSISWKTVQDVNKKRVRALIPIRSWRSFRSVALAQNRVVGEGTDCAAALGAMLTFNLQAHRLDVFRSSFSALHRLDLAGPFLSRANCPQTDNMFLKLTLWVPAFDVSACPHGSCRLAWPRNLAKSMTVSWLRKSLHLRGTWLRP